MQKKLTSNFWSNKLKLIYVLVFHLCSGFSQAQVNTFVYTYKDWGCWDIVEDTKNGYLFNIYGKVNRIDKFGNKIFDFYDAGAWIIRQVKEDSNSYYLFGNAVDVGGFGFHKIDYSGNLLEENYIYAENDHDSTVTPMDVFYDEKRGQFIVCGSKSVLYSTKTHFWIAGVDKKGKIIWQNSFFDKGKHRYFSRILPNKSTGGYLLLGNENYTTEYSEIFTTDSLGQLLTRHFLDSCYVSTFLTHLMQIIDLYPYRDSLFLISGRTKCNWELNYYVVDKQGKPKQKIQSSYFGEFHLNLDNGNLLIAIGDHLALLDQNFNLIWHRQKLFGEHKDMYYEMRKIQKSKDGGFYGIAEGISNNNNNLVFVFKTDSEGLIHPQNKYSEWDQPLMLIPNPASQKVRIAIPYFYGQIQARFFDAKGNFISQQTHFDTELFDIQHLSPGMYFVQAVNLNTQESRTLKLVVE